MTDDLTIINTDHAYNAWMVTSLNAYNAWMLTSLNSYRSCNQWLKTKQVNCSYVENKIYSVKFS